MGLVSNAFDDRTLASLPGDAAIGQTRYSTPPDRARGATPSPCTGVWAITSSRWVTTGNLVNTEALAADAGMLPGTVASDSDLVAELVASAMMAGSRTVGPHGPLADAPGFGAAPRWPAPSRSCC